MFVCRLWKFVFQRCLGFLLHSVVTGRGNTSAIFAVGIFCPLASGGSNQPVWLENWNKQEKCEISALLKVFSKSMFQFYWTRTSIMKTN